MTRHTPAVTPAETSPSAVRPENAGGDSPIDSNKAWEGILDPIDSKEVWAAILDEREGKTLLRGAFIAALEALVKKCGY